MVKRSSKNIIVHTIDDEDDTDEGNDNDNRTEAHQHIAYAFAGDKVSQQTSFVPLPASPRSKRARLSPFPSDAPSLGKDTTEGGDPDENDLNYLWHRIEQLGLEDTPAARARTAGDRPLLTWLRYDVQNYLDELMRQEGRGDFTAPTCPRCSQSLASSEAPGYRCDDCDDSALYCQNCTKEQHVRHPLHRVKWWTGTHFERVTLKSLGLRIQLGHRPGDKCYSPVAAFGDAFVVMDLHGIHEVGLDFCACALAAPSTSQLLRYRLYPATSTDPRTAATFRLLETFHLLSAQSKVSAFEFYSTLARRSDNTGTQPPKDRYVSFLHMIRQWRHLKMLKRGGRGNVPQGATAVPQGSCAVECPACPHPGKNLPDEWESAPKNKLYLAIDGNFRLKRKNISASNLDPALNAGCAYFVEDSAYEAHLKEFDSGNAKETLPGECNTHDAVKLANIKGAAGLAATGVVTVDCSRHDMKCPCSIGDLQKGESYSVRFPIRWVKYGYDTNIGRQIMWSIPMFHLNAHRERCRSVFSPYLLLYSGRLNGEGVERRWAMANGYAPATKEMGPGSRHDMLDDVFGDQNWAKVTKLPVSLLSRIKVAVVERAKHVNAYNQFTSSLPANSVSQWKEMVHLWDESPSTAPNPYEYRRTHITQGALRVELAEEDADDIRAGRASAVHEYYSASTIVVVGMEIEDQQRKLLTDSSALGSYPTDMQRAKLIERQNALQRRIDGWRKIQNLFMPSVVTLITQAGSGDDSPLPQRLPLFLPSAACIEVVVSPCLLNHEWRMRQAQAYDALTDLRGHLEVRAYIYQYKDQHVRGQREITRSRDIVNGIEAKIKLDAARYRAAYIALTTLSGALSKVNWRGPLQPLLDSDIRHVAAGDGTGSESRRELSWIWKAGSVTSADGVLLEGQTENLQEGLRVEWCKARARALRWIEEVQIVEEEMCRTKQYLKWHSQRWEAYVPLTPQQRADLHEGATAYAYRQASIRQKMAAYCEHAWRPDRMRPRSVGFWGYRRRRAIGGHKHRQR
ncbi:hypothetical protein C8T65DRAFT_700284 [Cerioporus squamosus]|nr:hypothetical protein C8T65DRAFT_700284 [Cerioporus squamosus]